MQSYQIDLADADATVALGKQLAALISAPCVVYLIGDLGAGKTTFSRGLIQGFGYEGNVKSPTYTLVEPYELADVSIYHFDLYRLADPQELEFIGIEEYFTQSSICLVEWPDKGQGWLASADIQINIEHKNEQRSAEIVGLTAIGQKIVEQLA
ncbi:tRNA (adenosine(37)-N6)-threonylcarbamoyltransferase complex ATPase subunit type 1 TsaE [Catenovulum agarivorans]|uniref:tRNA (adenosine(37)-N6)-threonylcarbamoyltransferase complex ATPase subunit type 1 TsaE n=1 Tax=Catenovulum agarivorans TaxID=1172192 RepID=UPI0002F3B79B|nr:tRNA (adenosine(37)-N6)-threonylcarbamoyltransferase complex ATPase subunit type 1 TsaE [Catenovulum agarivorans]